MFIEDLIEFGLTEKEAQTYITLLSLEIAAAQEISKKAGINRSSIYVILESLKKKGLVSISKDKNVLNYVATQPDTLIRMAENSAKKQADVRKKVYDIIPELKGMYKGTKKKPVIKVFEGKEGIKRVYEDALLCKKGTTLYAVSQPSIWEKLDENYGTYLKEKRIKNGILLKAIYPHEVSKQKDFFIKVDKKRLAEFRFLPKGKGFFSSDFRIYDNKIALTSLKDEVGIIIENKEIAEIIRHMFELTWEKSDKIEEIEALD